MKSLIIGLVAATAFVAGTSAQQPASVPVKPEDAKPALTKQDPKPAPDSKTIVGKWTLSVDTQNGAMANTLDLKLDGKKVTGSITSQMGTSDLTGEFADGKLAFNISFDGPNGAIQVAFTGALKDDGSMAGSAAITGMDAMTWTAQRVKDK